MLSHTTAAVIGMAGGSTRKNGGKKMTAHSIVVLLGMVVAAMPAGADQQGVKVTPAADLRETDDEEQEDIGDDAGLITNEFSYTYLFDQRYGVLAGFGKSSPRQLMHLEGLTFLREKLAVSMLIGYGMDQNFDSEAYDHTADTLSLSVKARYYLPLLPLSANTSCGYVFWQGNIVSHETGGKHDYKSYEAYLGVSLSAYYFWKTGIYIESVIYGIGIGKAFGLQTDTDNHKDIITAAIKAVEHYGIFGGGLLNIAVGYLL